MKYLIALDIDGTITDHTTEIPVKIIDFLHKCSQNDALIAFVTGRFYPYAQAQLNRLPFPFYLACQNGAQLYQMPERKNLYNFYVSKDLIMMIDQLTHDLEEDFIVYGDQNLDFQVFYRDQKFSQKMLSHIFKLDSSSYHPFIKINSFTDLPARAFPCVKHFGTIQQTKPFYDKVSRLPIEISMIKEPSSKDYYMNLITHQKASKGEAISNLLKIVDRDMPIIAAGNDLNDVTLLKKADIGIAVGPRAPTELKNCAKILCDSHQDLDLAIEKAKKQLGI